MHRAGRNEAAAGSAHGEFDPHGSGRRTVRLCRKARVLADRDFAGSVNPPRKDGQLGEEPLVGGVQCFHAPRDAGPQRLLARRRVARAGSQNRQRIADPIPQLGDGQPPVLAAASSTSSGRRGQLRAHADRSATNSLVGPVLAGGLDEHAASRGPGFDTLESGQMASSANSRVWSWVVSRSAWGPRRRRHEPIE